MIKVSGNFYSLLVTFVSRYQLDRAKKSEKYRAMCTEVDILCSPVDLHHLVFVVFSTFKYQFGLQTNISFCVNKLVNILSKRTPQRPSSVVLIAVKEYAAPSCF